MNLKRYAFFVQTVHSGSLSAAAEVLGCSQSAVSQMIAALEQELGVRLLHRSRVGIRLTEEGRLLLPEIETMLEAQRRIESICTSLRGGERGTVVVASFSSVAVQWLPRIFKAFGEAHPGVELRLNTGDYADVSKWLESGTANIGFITPQFGESYRYIPLYRDPLLAVLPPEHPLAGGEEFPVEQVAKEPFLGLLAASDQDAREYLASFGITPNTRLTTKDDYAILAMVRSGLGMSIMQGLLLRGETEGLRLLPLKPRAYRTIGLALTEEGEQNPAVRSFASFVQAWVRENWRDGAV
jgi:DNA-binding transcriptional LysR family regulator